MSSLIGSPPETGSIAPTAPARQGLSTGRARAARRTLRVLVAVVALGAAWALIAPNYPSFVFPTPSDVWASFTRAAERGVWVEQVIATLGHLGSAFAIVLVAGLPLGILIGRSIIAEDL
ncbi:MAG: hypothetical protein M3381_03805, partial [Actinomycetota bacterium]|nr:hypothetical protein [Actinomycetota bacterium]